MTAEIDTSGLWYDPFSGLLMRTNFHSGHPPGRFVLTKDKDGYIVIKVGRRMYMGHRVAWFMHYEVETKRVKICDLCPVWYTGVDIIECPECKSKFGKAFERKLMELQKHRTSEQV